MAGWNRSLCLRRTALVLFAALVAPASALSGEPNDGDQDRDILMIRGQAVEGKIIEMNDQGFKFRMKVGEDEMDVHLTWDVLPPTEVDRLRGRRPGAALEELMRSGGGDLVEATRFHFKNGRVLVGLELREKSTAEEIVIRSRNAPEFRIRRTDVERTEPVMLPETALYAPEELYLKLKAEMNPREARGHFELGVELMKIRHWTKAKEHFQRAMLLDERFKESAGQKIAECDASETDSQVIRLDRMIETAVRAGRWGDALIRIKRLSAIAPDHPRRTAWDSKIEAIRGKLQKSLRRDIVRAYYNKMDTLIRKRARGLVSVEGIPGVRVTLRSGQAVAGKLVADNEEFVVIKTAEKRTIKFAKDLVDGVDAVNLSQKRAQPAFADSKAHVTDTSGGVTAEILKGLEDDYKDLSTEDLPITQKLIQDFWKNRLTQVEIRRREGRELTLPVYSLHEATYGTGTWLRDGATVVPTQGAGNRGGAVETDPEKWWKSQRPEVRFQVLRAFAAEALCLVDKVIKLRCPRCGGKGYILTVDMGRTSATVGTVGAATRPCGTCRGSGHFIKIRYR